MAVTRWVFADPQTSATYTFALNPSDGGTPNYTRNINTQTSSAPTGQSILFEGRRPLPTGTFTGVVLTQADYTALLTWFNKPYPINMTDDLGRTFQIVITSFQATRKRAYGKPWKHDYTVSFTVVV